MTKFHASLSPDVRAGTLRAVRYLVRSLLDVMALSSVQVMLLIQNICNNVLGIWCCRMKVIFLQLPLLLTRTLDLDLDNKGERLQGVKLARRSS